MMDSAIEVVGLRKSYGGQEALRGLDLTVPGPASLDSWGETARAKQRRSKF